MINYILSEKLQKTIVSSNISKSDEISTFIDEILQAGNSNYKLDHSEYIDWIKSPEFMLNQIEGIMSEGQYPIIKILGDSIKENLI